MTIFYQNAMKENHDNAIKIHLIRLNEGWSRPLKLNYTESNSRLRYYSIIYDKYKLT